MSVTNNRTLYYFTNTYPYGKSPIWKKNELEVLKRYFRKVVVVPLTYGGDEEPRDLVDGVEYREPIIDAEHSRTDRSVAEKIRIALRLIKTPVPRQFIRELLSPKVLFRFSRVRELLRATYELALFQKNAALTELFDGMKRDESVLYFYWGIGQVNALLLKRADELPFAACRFHAWDLYDERHKSGYIPYRRRLLEILDLILPCSSHGVEYLKARSGSIDKKIFTARLGTTSTGRSNAKADGVLRIVTCSNVVEVKRLDLLCEALIKIKLPVHWTHIGDGELMPTVREYVGRFPPNVTTDLRGSVPSSDVPGILANGFFDLFINTSSSEGVPVAIMEAFAAGIPVLATDVGGTSEIVDDSVGRLVHSTINPAELAKAIEDFYSLDESAKWTLRDNAFLRYREQCDVVANAEALALMLLNAAA